MDSHHPTIGPLPLAEPERARLLRLCLRVTRDRQQAEDLTQEALLEAWRHADSLRDLQARDRWLAGIARNVCRRWLRAQSQERSRHLLTREATTDAESDPLAALPDPNDLTIALERDELATLLDRALGLLPPETRALLIAHYIEESPHAALAAQFGTSEKAVSMRLTRGKLLLRRVLTTRFRDAAIAHGLVPSSPPDRWQETRIWCPLCGQHRLFGHFDNGTNGAFALRCPGCHPGASPIALSATTFADTPALGATLAGVSGYRAAFNRLLAWCAAHYRDGLARGTAPCPRCGTPGPIVVGPPAHWPPLPHTAQMIHLRCDRCGITPNVALIGLVLALPEAQQFWRTHRRIRVLPTREIAHAGQTALLTTYESVVSGHTLDVIAARHDYAILHSETTDGR